MMNPIKKIMDSCTEATFTTHVSLGGQLYIPRDLGAVHVTLSGIDENGIYIKIMPDRKNPTYRKTITVGKALVSSLFVGSAATTHPITFLKTGRGWFGRIKKES